MNRFIVHPLVWHDDIRTNHEVVFTRPRPDADLHFPSMVSPSRAQKVKARENFTTC